MGSLDLVSASDYLRVTSYLRRPVDENEEKTTTLMLHISDYQHHIYSEIGYCFFITVEESEKGGVINICNPA